MADAPEMKRTWEIPEHLRLELLAALEGEPRQSETMTFEEFLAWVDEDTYAEWVEGRVEMPSPASLRHQDIQQFLAELLALFVRANTLGKIVSPPFVMRLPRSAREPDLIFVAQEHLDQLHDTYLDGPADLVIEILSPESMARDRGTKYQEYGDGGVPEYWLIDPIAESAEFYQLDAQRHYHPIAPDANGIYRPHALPGFWLDVSWLWQTPLPNVIKTMKQVAPEAYRRYAGE